MQAVVATSEAATQTDVRLPTMVPCIWQCRVLETDSVAHDVGDDYVRAGERNDVGTDDQSLNAAGLLSQNPQSTMESMGTKRA